MTHSLFLYDYETTGTHPQKDRPLQFAGVRTDVDFNIIDDPISLYCKVSLDILPHPMACLLTGITPQRANEEGLCEADFMRRIHQALSTPGTCSLGYNSIRFDDEVTRHGLYRNFFDAYAREWQHGNSRWDLLDVFRAAHALRPQGINWVYDNDDVAVFKLDQLTAANGIAHANAHDALADVYATLALAQRLKCAQPRLFNFFFEHRSKFQALKLLNVGAGTPLVHVSGMYPAAKHCLAVVLPLCVHPSNANEVIVYDLSVEPSALLTLSAEDIKQRLFVPTHALPENVSRIPLKTVHINKCPVLAPLSVLTPIDAQRLQLNLEVCQAHAKQILAAGNLTPTLHKVFANTLERPDLPVNVDLSLYSGGFFSAVDQQAMIKIRNTPPEELANLSFRYEDKRMSEMLFRYRARNYPNTLTGVEWERWREFCFKQLTSATSDASVTFTTYQQALNDISPNNAAQQAIKQALLDYAHDKCRQLDIDSHTFLI